MPASVAEAISRKGKSLRDKLKVIVSLIFILPSAVVFYILSQEDISLHFRYASAIMLGLSLTLALVGMVLLREVFSEFIRLAAYMKEAEEGRSAAVETKQDIRELDDISVSFNHLLEKLRSTAELLEEQTARLNQEMTERMRVEEELRENEKRLTHLTSHDILTGLPNRETFKEHLRRLLADIRRRKGHLAVILLDLDNFKTVNDTLGHTIGDLVLQEASRRLTEGLRESDIVARLGGDEFSIVLPNIMGPDDCSIVATKLLRSMGTPFACDGHDLYIGTSIGISRFPEDGDDEDTLLKNADTAMYQAKEMGRNTFQSYTRAMSVRPYEDFSLSNDLRKALQNGEFFMTYQPQYDLSTGRIDGAEALIRWNHPVMGILPPMKFIPLAERTGLIIPLGEWILESICAQIRTWHDEGRQPVRVSVNTSARQFQEKELALTVERAIKGACIDPSQFELELTESIIMQDIQGTTRTLRQLNGLGIRISVDDFGTGYSSLSYLKQFPIHTLKIDRTFIRDITTDPDDASIVTAVIAMAHSLRMDVIAEGVETLEQLEFLRRLNCDRIQGYLMSRPVPVDAFSRLLTEDTAKHWEA